MSCEDPGYHKGEFPPSGNFETHRQADGVPDAESTEHAAKEAKAAEAASAVISTLTTEVTKAVNANTKPDLADDLNGWGWGV